jgi:CysZ protein
MVSIGKSLFLAVLSLFSPRMLWLMVWPVLVSLILWGAAALAFWTNAAAAIATQLGRLVQPLVAYVPFDLSAIATVSANLMLFVLIVPVVYLTALIILGIFGMDAMVDHVAARNYPDLARKHGGGTAGSVWNAIVALCGLVLLFLVTLPLLLVWPLWAVAQAAVMGWVNQKLLRYEALAAHASAEEMRTIFTTRRAGLYQLGLVLSLVVYVPVIGIFAPMLFALAFIHFGLASLQELRGAPVEGQVIEGEVIGTAVRPG